MKKLLLSILFMGAVGGLNKVHSHEIMVSHGYFSCTACHRSATGAGMLTEYGKGIATATSLVGGEYHPGKVKKWLSVGGKLDHTIQARLAHVDNSRKDRVFPMQVDYLANLTLSEKNEIAFTLARAPNSARILGSTQTVEEAGGLHAYFVRKLLYTHTIDKKMQVQVGRDFVAYGLNIDDHSLYIRSQNKFGVTDFPTQARFVWEEKNRRHFFSLLAPSFQEADTNREYGFAVKNEFTTFKKGPILGASALYGKTDVLTRYLLGGHIKVPLPGFLFLGQHDITFRDVEGQDQSYTQHISMARLIFTYFESLSPYLLVERLDQQGPTPNKRTQKGVGAAWRLFGRWSVMSDYRRTGEGRQKEEYIITQLYLNWF